MTTSKSKARLTAPAHAALVDPLASVERPVPAGTNAAGSACLAGALASANNWTSTDRFAALGDHLAASFTAQSLGGRAEAGYRFGTPTIGITPYGALSAISFHQPSYNETDLSGGFFALALAEQTAKMRGAKSAPASTKC
jgi:uncharacterized protein with beta-barrel porin domain